MSQQSLETLLQKTSPVKLLRNSAIGPYVYPVVASEYTNWRDEQRAWQKTYVLFNQSYHMTDMYVEGPDALKLFSDISVNSFTKFDIGQSKHVIHCDDDGKVIHEGILSRLSAEEFRRSGNESTIGRPFELTDRNGTDSSKRASDSLRPCVGS